MDLLHKCAISWHDTPPLNHKLNLILQTKIALFHFNLCYTQNSRPERQTRQSVCSMLKTVVCSVYIFQNMIAYLLLFELKLMKLQAICCYFIRLYSPHRWMKKKKRKSASRILFHRFVCFICRCWNLISINSQETDWKTKNR